MALYNNGFPMTYPQMYYPQMPSAMPQQAPVQQPAQQPAVQNNSSIIWVSGENGAKSFLVAPNTTVVLFDSEASVIYIKSADVSGMPSLKILDYTIRGQNESTSPLNNPENYATKDEVNTLAEQISAIKNEIKEFTSKTNSRSTKTNA